MKKIPWSRVELESGEWEGRKRPCSECNKEVELKEMMVIDPEQANEVEVCDWCYTKMQLAYEELQRAIKNKRDYRCIVCGFSTGWDEADVLGCTYCNGSPG